MTSPLASRRPLHSLQLIAVAVSAALAALGAAHAEEAAAPAAASSGASTDADAGGKTQLEAVVVSNTRTTRSAVTLAATEMQKAIPGVNPLKAIETLPGVLYTSADPWGNNEQNANIFVHGFSTQQLGYTLDGVPLGDQQYGNYNGLSPQRAVISENVAAVTLASGAGDLPTASTSNLGGAITMRSADPLAHSGLQLQQTLGSYSTTRSFLRYDSGLLAGDNAFYLSYAHQQQRAWDFHGYQGGNQFNGKYTRNNAQGKLTVYLDYSDKIEPNEDAVYHGTPAGQGAVLPYTRPFLYPDFNAALSYLDAKGNTPASQGNNYSNYYSAAQRTDSLGYVKYEWSLDDNLSWSNQVYYHRDRGAGLVAGPITAAGLPQLFGVYFPNQNLKQVFGNSGYATRTTEYAIDRGGFLSSVDWQLGEHDVSAGVWYEHNRASAKRRWYPLDVNNPSSPYERPSDPLITQYDSEISVNIVQPYLQDQWKLSRDLLLQGGFKSSIQHARGWVPVQPLPGSTVGVTQMPEGSIDTSLGFLPQLGLLWNLSPKDEVFVNVQKNARQFITYGAGGLSPWSMGTQAAFDDFKANVSPETAWTYEAGLRTQKRLDFGPVSGFEGQVSVYHVDFQNRLLSISPTPVISAIVGGAPIIKNVGGVTTNGIDINGTLHFGPMFSLYDALSYNHSVYDADYTNGTTVVPTAGKLVPGMPKWMNKLVASLHYGEFEAELSGDFVGSRYATYTNDLSVGSSFTVGLQASYKLDTLAPGLLKDSKLSLNVANLGDAKGVSTLGVGAASGTYNTYPIAPRQFFVTFSTRL